jgi:transcriptional regulator with AAA-type ATPase domain
MSWLDQIKPLERTSPRILPYVKQHLAYTFFMLKDGAFRVVERSGYPAGSGNYSFLEKTELWAPALESGFTCLPSMGLIPGRNLWVVVDDTSQVSAILAAEADTTDDLGILLRFLLIAEMAMVGQEMPVWLRDHSVYSKGKKAPYLIVSEQGSGREYFVRSLVAETPGHAVYFHPGRLSAAVQMRELFGENAGARLGGQAAAVPIIARADVIIIEEAAGLDRMVQLRILEMLRAGDHHCWIFQTSFDLKLLAEEGGFVPGLLHLLESGMIVLPPLRAVKQKLEEEVFRILDQLRRRHGRSIEISPAALDKMKNYLWPGNLRELEAVLESAFLQSEGVIEPEDLRMGDWNQEETDDLNLRNRTRDLEKSLILRAYALHGGNQVHMARALGISRGSLQYKLEKFGLH